MQIRDVSTLGLESDGSTIKESKKEISPTTQTDLSHSKSEDFSSTLKTLRQISADIPKSQSLETVLPSFGNSSSMAHANKPDAYETFLSSHKYAELESNGFKQLFCISIDSLHANETDPIRRAKLMTLEGTLNAHIADLGGDVIGTPTAISKPSMLTSMVLFSKGNQLYRVPHRAILSGVSNDFASVNPIPYDGVNAVVYVMIAKKLPNMPGFQILIRHQSPNNDEIIKEDLRRFEKNKDALRATPPSGHPGLFNKDEPLTTCLGAGEKYSIATNIVLLNNKTGSLHSNFSSVLSNEDQKLLADTIFAHTYRANVRDRQDGHYHVANPLPGQCEKELLKDLEKLNFVEDFYKINSKLVGDKLSSLTTIPGLLTAQGIFSDTARSTSTLGTLSQAISEIEGQVSTGMSTQTSNTSELDSWRKVVGKP